MDIERHSKARAVALARSIAGRSKIYLDTRFWIIARDAETGLRTDASSQNLLNCLRRGVESGILVCPIGPAVFLELMKQQFTVDRRMATTRLIDELSMGVAMAPDRVVLGTEIHSFLLKAKGGAVLHPMQELVWTKVAYVLGDLYLALKELAPAEALAAQRQFFDHLWEHSLTVIISAIGDSSPVAGAFVELSKITNEKNKEYRHELGSFAQAYDIELRGIVEIAGEVAADVVQHLAGEEAGQKLTPTAEERSNSVNVCRNILYHALKKPEAKSALRSMYISASIHAGMRWDKERKFKPNDYYNFEHATAALAYCDAFFTEGPLHHLVTRPQLNLQAVNGCRVFSDVSEAADYVGELASQGSHCTQLLELLAGRGI